MDTMKMPVLILLLAAICGGNCMATTGEDSVLFYIQRSLDDDKIVYWVNFGGDGNIDTRQPIGYCWVNSQKGGKVEPVAWIKRKFGYGLIIHQATPYHVKFSFVSDKNNILVLKRNLNGKYVVLYNIAGEGIELEKIFIKMEGSTFWDPGVREVTFTGVSQEHNGRVSRSIVPPKLQDK